MKIAILGDLHFGRNGNDEFINNKIGNFLTNEFFPYLKKNNISTMVMLGDLFDNRKSINNLIIDYVNKYYIDPIIKNNIKCFQIVGNHDCYYTNTNEINSPGNILQRYSNFNIIDKSFYSEDLQSTFTGWNYLPDKKQGKYLFGHFPFTGFEYQSGIVEKNGVDPIKVGFFMKVFSGHFHKKDEKSNIVYVGSPIELDFGEINYEHRFIVLDTLTNVHESIPTKTKIFEKVIYEENKENVIPDVKDKIIKIVALNVSDENEFEKYKNKINELGVHEIRVSKINIEVNDILEIENIDDVGDIFQIMVRWVKERSEQYTLKEDIFLKLVSKLYKDVQIGK